MQELFETRFPSTSRSLFGERRNPDHRGPGHRVV